MYLLYIEWSLNLKCIFKNIHFHWYKKSTKYYQGEQDELEIAETDDWVFNHSQFLKIIWKAICQSPKRNHKLHIATNSNPANVSV